MRCGEAISLKVFVSCSRDCFVPRSDDREVAFQLVPGSAMPDPGWTRMQALVGCAVAKQSLLRILFLVQETASCLAVTTGRWAFQLVPGSAMPDPGWTKRARGVDVQEVHVNRKK